MNLHRTQHLMKETLLGTELNNDLSVQLSNERRLFIYQNTISGQLLDVLSSTYNTVRALVGEEYFSILADGYIREYPPEEASLTFYGENFADYLTQQEALQSMPYIFDMATYEKAWNHAFFAVDADFLNPASLVSLNEDDLEHVSFVMHPSVCLLTVSFPVYELWRWVEDGATDSAPDISKASRHFAVWRNAQLEVMVKAIVAEDFKIWGNIVAAMPISKAFAELATAEHGEWLESILMSSMVTSYKLERET